MNSHLKLWIKIIGISKRGHLLAWCVLTPNSFRIYVAATSPFYNTYYKTTSPCNVIGFSKSNISMQKSICKSSMQKSISVWQTPLQKHKQKYSVRDIYIHTLSWRKWNSRYLLETIQWDSSINTSILYT